MCTHARPDARDLLTSATVEADTHPLMQRLHPPGEEKRPVVVRRGSGPDAAPL